MHNILYQKKAGQLTERDKGWMETVRGTSGRCAGEMMPGLTLQGSVN